MAFDATANPIDMLKNAPPLVQTMANQVVNTVTQMAPGAVTELSDKAIFQALPEDAKRIVRDHFDGKPSLAAGFIEPMGISLQDLMDDKNEGAQRLIQVMQENKEFTGKLISKYKSNPTEYAATMQNIASTEGAFAAMWHKVDKNNQLENFLMNVFDGDSSKAGERMLKHADKEPDGKPLLDPKIANMTLNPSYFISPETKGMVSEMIRNTEFKNPESQAAFKALNKPSGMFGSILGGESPLGNMLAYAEQRKPGSSQELLDFWSSESGQKGLLTLAENAKDDKYYLMNASMMIAKGTDPFDALEATSAQLNDRMTVQRFGETIGIAPHAGAGTGGGLSSKHQEMLEGFGRFGHNWIGMGLGALQNVFTFLGSLFDGFLKNGTLDFNSASIDAKLADLRRGVIDGDTPKIAIETPDGRILVRAAPPADKEESDNKPSQHATKGIAEPIPMPANSTL